MNKYFLRLSFLIYQVFFDSLKKVNCQLNSESNIVLKSQEPIINKIKLPQWKPKTEQYDPTIVDWRSVISGCKASCRFDKRLCNFYIRAAAHDSFSISEGFGGADGSVLLTMDEIKRPENNYDSWAYLLSKNALALAKKYNTSVADIIAVCGAVSTEYLGGPKIISYDTNLPFLVGRFDSIEPNPPNKLPGSNINLTSFANFAKNRNLTMEEMTALMGSHSLIDENGCKRPNGSICDPTKGSCLDLMMYKWSNKYYKDACSPNIRINDPPVRSSEPLQTLESLRKHNMCKFTSPELRSRSMDIFDNEIITMLGNKEADSLVIDLDTEMEHVSWFSKNLTSKKWLYTVHDAWMGKACQRKVKPNIDYHNFGNVVNIGNSMNDFKNNATYWNQIYIRAYKKMVNTGAKWSIKMSITGDECPSGYISALKTLILDCSKCDEKARMSNNYNCNTNCKCKTGMSNSVKFYE